MGKRSPAGKKASASPRIVVDGTLVFSLLLFVVVVLYAVGSLGFSEIGRQLPLVVSAPTALLILIGVLTPSDGKQTFDTMADDMTVAAKDAATAEPRRRAAWEKRLQVYRAFGWPIFLVTLIILVGFAWAFPSFLLLYSRFEARLGWIESIVSAAIIWVVIIWVPGGLLNIGMYQGVLW